MTNTAAVEITLVDLERTNVGRVRAYAVVEIEVDGIEFVLQGITVVEVGRELRIEAPWFRRDGERLAGARAPG